ncbi:MULTISPECIES: M14 family metallopeptidase [unclassified Agromyces]|uniref:M14 family metallopeptidase n=1 Tax=unclassified Agromyces TaxID=2639701 RepID=UPI003014B811
MTRRALGGTAATAALAGLLLTGMTPISPAAGTEQLPELAHDAHEEVGVVEVVLPDRSELDRLVDTGVDLDHAAHLNPDATITAHAVISDGQAKALEARGFDVGKTVHDEDDTASVLAERDATIAAAVEENQEFAAAAESAAVSDVKIIRADYYTSFGVGYLSVEAKWAGGQASSAQLTVQRDSGPGTAPGSGGSQNISRFVDAGVYLYHRGAAVVTTRPDTITITSPTGDVATAKVNDWLPIEGEPEVSPDYQTDFITSYLTPTELYDRIKGLADEFPEIAEIVELPHQTNGYRRLAQAVLGSSNASRVAVDSTAWGHEGGNEVGIALTNPGTADAPLSVSVTGDDITVSLATNSAGAVTSTAAQVVAAINASAAASELVTAYTYRGNAGAGVVAPVAATALSDGLNAPSTVSRDPQTVYAIRIGKVRDGSKMGVLAYAQEHAREWVPPLVTIETAERLLRNYELDGRTKQLVNNLDIWIVPSVNPDGGHYSFYDFNSQRKNMTNHCPQTTGDFLARNNWGVDNNRNYDTYSLFDGYDGASNSCTSGTYAGPSELSEPESANIDWIASQNDNIEFAMNLHSSGNYFMWSPGAYIADGRVSAPRPTLEEESYFWGASSRILTEIKRYRGMSVTPARTGPISDVLYSAAGNSGDMLWYKHGIYAWNFEVGTQFQPPFSNENPSGASAHAESQEYANGLVELMRVAYDFGRDKVRPESTLSATASSEPGMVDLTFATTESAAVFYTLDGSKPTYESTLYASAGIREGGEVITVPVGTKVHWFSVDSAGNIEKNYRPDGGKANYNKFTVVAAG